MNKLFAITPGRSDPASRFRVLQLVPHLARRGWCVDHAPVWPVLDGRAQFVGTALARTEQIVLGRLRRLAAGRLAARAAGADAMLVCREMPWGIKRLLARNPRLIFDFDDAIHLGAMAAHVAWMCRNAAIVIAGNETLADFARAHARDVVVIPTLIDTDAYTVRTDHAVPGRRVRIVWLGSDASIRQTLLPHLDILAAAQVRLGFELVVITAPLPPIRHPTLVWRHLPWSPSVERDVARAGEIGIMPLADTPYQRAKCAGKLLQYMAAGLPSVASPIGVNASILAASGAGFAARTAAEWMAALTLLCADATLRAAMGARGRAFCVERFSVRAWLPTWLGTVERAARSVAAAA